MFCRYNFLCCQYVSYSSPYKLPFIRSYYCAYFCGQIVALIRHVFPFIAHGVFVFYQRDQQELEYLNLAFECEHATGRFASRGSKVTLEDNNERRLQRGGGPVEIACVYKANGLKITERCALWASRGENVHRAYEGGRG